MHFSVKNAKMAYILIIYCPYWFCSLCRGSAELEAHILWDCTGQQYRRVHSRRNWQEWKGDPQWKVMHSRCPGTIFQLIIEWPQHRSLLPHELIKNFQICQVRAEFCGLAAHYKTLSLSFRPEECPRSCAWRDDKGASVSLCEFGEISLLPNNYQTPTTFFEILKWLWALCRKVLQEGRSTHSSLTGLLWAFQCG